MNLEIIHELISIEFVLFSNMITCIQQKTISPFNFTFHREHSTQILSSSIQYEIFIVIDEDVVFYISVSFLNIFQTLTFHLKHFTRILFSSIKYEIFIVINEDVVFYIFVIFLIFHGISIVQSESKYILHILNHALAVGSVLLPILS